MKYTRTIPLPQFVARYQIDKLFFILTATFLLPFLVHLIPWTDPTPLGAVWLPIFYAPLVAVFFFRAHVAILAAVMAPTLNMLLVGKPLPPMAKMLTVELIIFVLFSLGLSKIKKGFWAAGAVSYVLAKGISTYLLKMSGSGLGDALTTAVPGILLLLILNIGIALYSHKNLS